MKSACMSHRERRRITCRRRWREKSSRSLSLRRTFWMCLSLSLCRAITPTSATSTASSSISPYGRPLSLCPPPLLVTLAAASRHRHLLAETYPRKCRQQKKCRDQSLSLSFSCGLTLMRKETCNQLLCSFHCSAFTL